ncbi:TnsD family Tn7-like transposition protein [Chromobacterium sp. Panama]|uniref:TnsD family Tn7-like transposition protein n=1 Tax=Chromobacterium sp. Panama TaxID=2161826 RepID=UPI00351A07A0
MSTELLRVSGSTIYTSLRWRYAAWLMQVRLAKQPTYIDQRALTNAIEAYWHPLHDIPPFDRLLNDLQQREGHWLTTLCRHPRAAHHPLKHLLLIGFLAPDIDTFLAIDPAPPPRSGNTNTTKPPYHDERLTRLSCLLEQEPMSLRQAAKCLGLSTNTVIILAQRLHISVKTRPKQLNTSTCRRLQTALVEPRRLIDIAKAHHTSLSTLYRLLATSPTTQALRRQSILARRRLTERTYLRYLRRRSRTTTWQQLRHQAPATCVWLSRHDQAWLGRFKSTLPHAKNCRRPVVDWQARDRAMVVALQKATLTLLSFQGKPLRISLPALAELIEHPDWLNKQLDKLPLTQIYLKEHLEPVSTFQQRRLNWFRQQSQKEMGHMPPDWLLRRLAGLP